MFSGGSLKKRHIAIGTGLLLVALGASAVSLGRVRGVPLIGRGLDVSVPATLAAGDAANLGAQAEVYYADNRVDGNRVQVTVEPGPTADEPTIRIRSSAAVDEPVVTVYLRAGCAGALSRRYVLFAEFVPDAPASGATLAAVSGSAAPAALTPIAAIVAGAATGPDPLPPAAASAVVASAVSLQASPAAVAVPPAPAAPAAASTPGGTAGRSGRAQGGRPSGCGACAVGCRQAARSRHRTFCRAGDRTCCQTRQQGGCPGRTRQACRCAGGRSGPPEAGGHSAFGGPFRPAAHRHRGHP